MILEILDPFLTCPLALLFFIAERKQFVNDLKKSLMFFIDDVYADIIFIPPYQLTFHL